MRGYSSTSKYLSLFLIISAALFLKTAFCAQSGLTEFQKQARVYRDQGWRAQKQGDLDSALAYYQKAVAVDPKYAVVYNDIGVILEAGGDLDGAIEVYLKAIDADPEYPGSYSNLALLYEELGDYAHAVSCWVNRAILGGPQDPWAEVARRRLEEIARIYPEAYKSVGPQAIKNNSKQF